MKSEFYKDAESRMKKTVETVRSDFSRIRTGKATPSLLDGIKVEYYGSEVPLSHVANVSVPEMRLLTIQPWEKNMVPKIEKAILKSDLGLNPTNDGKVVRVPIPELTEERRKELVKAVRKMAEDGRVAIRNIRRDENDKIKKSEKNHEISEDESHDEMDSIQELTDTYTNKIDELLEQKEKEIMEV